ncbi:hypothetical protein Ssi03_26390 [Sphaerisporangium siamense]|uniref:Methylamine utilisation protein MauE domain-containing protein n=1 Tax=Sphaerisporangium siamense TaxID=795645 RepID=A0A7W7D4D9_9ACTN|nr:MauE/DoxX family redox-associated membrane protein [Sphaerisporangium siamense]MBB4700033.1 hypothetical protein [Sphaerisporangium siamense]GII84649.1 hypothetical protein Ssi03_26390 [Sphaerisporangium siamense]
MELESLATAALALVVPLLILGGVAKAATAGSDAEPGALARLGPGVLVPERWRKPMMIFCAAVEGVLAAGLLLTPSPLPRWGTVTFFSVATYVLWELRRRRPDVGCGCFGEASGSPVGLRSIGRAAVLTGAAVLVALVPVTGSDLLAPSWDVVTAFGAGLALLAVLSPEMEEGLARVRYRAPCEQRPIAAPKALARLRSSGEWRSHQGMLVAEEPSDTWRELCWRFFVYPARAASGGGADVVFAVYLTGRRPPIRVAVVEQEGTGPIRESIGVSAGY